MSKYSPHALLHRKKLLSTMYGMGIKEGLVYLKGETIQTRKWTDVELIFRQESYFYYLTGVEEADAHLVIDISSSAVYLFVPEYDQHHSLWCGKTLSLSQMSQVYGVNVYYASEMDKIVSGIKSKLVYVINKNQMDTCFHGIELDDLKLKRALDECRVYKTLGEIELMKEAARITSVAHLELMRNAKKIKNERDGSALFNYECAKQGAPVQAYNPIVAFGRNGSVLHYVLNNAPIVNSSNMILVDAGCEFSCYASDVTRTYPVNGKFGVQEGIIYKIVLDSQEAVLKEMKPGVEWENMHRVAEKVILDGLIEAGIVYGDYQELIKHHISALFFPHGLGHLIGLDVHDVGGYPPGVERIKEPGIRYLRMRRTLEENMVITVEPGLYFIDEILDKALQDPIITRFINSKVLDKFRHIGGVRIEDDVLIVKNGIEILTKSIPKHMEEIEKIMSQ